MRGGNSESRAARGSAEASVDDETMERVNCPDTDLLASLAVLLGKDWDAAARHLQNCPRCRAELEDLAEFRYALMEEVEPAPGFPEGVVRALIQERAAPQNVHPTPLHAGVAWALTSVTLLTGILATSVAGVQVSSGLSAVALALAAGALVQHRLWPHGLLGPDASPAAPKPN
jgi:anti-sigma factor RsiW